MRKLLTAMAASGALLAGGAAVPASAADLSVAPAPAPYVAPVAVAAFTWSGGYLGLNAGGIWGKHDFDPVNATYLSGPVGACGAGVAACGFSLTTGRDSSFIGGIHFGDRWQFGQFVLGVEQDAQWTDVKNGFVLGANAPFAGGPFLAGDAFQAKLKYLGNTRAQLGVAFDRVLVYAAGGLATGIMDVTAAYVARDAGPLGSPGTFNTATNKFHVGFTLGGGVDFAVTNNVSIGVEYRYTELDKETYNLGAFTTGAGTVHTATADVGLKSHEVLGRLNIKTEPLLAIFGIR